MMVTTHGGRRSTERTVTAWAAEAAAAGAGEILLTSVDADGTKEGFDLEMLRAVRGVVDVPVVASGGAGDLDDFARAVLIGGADAVLAASVFHDRVFSIVEVKAAMKRAGLVVRPVPPRATPLQPRFDANGLVPVVVRDVETGDVLTLAWANAEALERTRETGLVPLLQPLPAGALEEGRDVGHVQEVVAISFDCDRDTVLYDVKPVGPACHTGARTCFTRVDTLAPAEGDAGRLDLTALFATIADRRDHPEEGSYTNRLLESGPARIAQKVGEEAVETALAAVGGTDEALANEAADLLYHLAVLLTARGLAPKDVAAVLERRRGAPRRGRSERRGPPPRRRRAPADLTTPVALMKALLAGDGPCFLLESVEGGDRVARWSFLGAAPSGGDLGRGGRSLRAPQGPAGGGAAEAGTTCLRSRGEPSVTRGTTPSGGSRSSPRRTRTRSASRRVVRDLRLRHRVRPREAPPPLRDTRGEGGKRRESL